MTLPSVPTRDWAPFRLVEPGAHAEAPRSIHTKEGIGDRLRAAGFAELQAREAFLWAAETFRDASEELRMAWKTLAAAEDLHLSWLMARLGELGFFPQDRGVSDQLWASLTACSSAEEFSLFMATAEDRGRRAGERFYQDLRDRDPVSAEIFRRIAEEEVEHIRLAETFFGFKPGQVETRSSSRPGGRTSYPPGREM
ncbi:MAG: DUF455 family protein [Bdellovibrionales bacterium]|nr:DUF455 family protein [Bdellovibrionales bacterium]